MDGDEQELRALRRRAFAIAYRMLGTVGEAEDIAQEALLRLHRERRTGADVASPEAFVATVSTRASIDALRSARRTREAYVGEWLPEPLVTDSAADPSERAQLADSLSFAFLVLLERLTPEQRAVFLLHEVFDYPYGEIASILGKGEQATRQLGSRARRRVAELGPRRAVSVEERAKLAERFFAAVEEGNLADLEAMLAEDVMLHGDGGGRTPALARPIRGRTRVAGTLRNWGRAAARMQDVRLERTELNRAPGAVLRDGAGRAFGAMALEIEGGSIRAIRSVVNPEKLEHLGPTANLGELLQRGGSPGEHDT